jgi:hypothetical protein
MLCLRTEDRRGNEGLQNPCCLCKGSADKHKRTVYIKKYCSHIKPYQIAGAHSKVKEELITHSEYYLDANNCDVTDIDRVVSSNNNTISGMFYLLAKKKLCKENIL